MKKEYTGKTLEFLEKIIQILVIIVRIIGFSAVFVFFVVVFDPGSVFGQTGSATSSSSSNRSSTSSSSSTMSSGIRSMDSLNLDFSGFVGGGDGDFVGGGDSSSSGSSSRSGTSSRSGSRSSNYRSSSSRNQNAYGQQGYGSSSINNEIRTRFAIAFDSPVIANSSTGSQNRASRGTTLNARLGKISALNRLGSISTEVVGREVTLRGTLRTEQDRKLAERIVLLEPGVSTVRNEITVVQDLDSGSTPTPGTID